MNLNSATFDAARSPQVIASTILAHRAPQAGPSNCGKNIRERRSYCPMWKLVGKCSAVPQRGTSNPANSTHPFFAIPSNDFLHGKFKSPPDFTNRKFFARQPKSKKHGDKTDAQTPRQLSPMRMDKGAHPHSAQQSFPPVPQDPTPGRQQPS